MLFRFKIVLTGVNIIIDADVRIAFIGVFSPYSQE